jgi:hypothetical protein
LTLALTLAAATSAPRPAAAQESFRLSGERVALYNLAGHVEVVRGTGADVVVHVTARGADADELSVEVGALGGRNVLRVIYPGDAVIYRDSDLRGRFSSQVRVRDDGTFGGGRGGRRVEVRSSGSGLEAHADLRVEVPAGRDVALYLAAGRADARGVQADLLMDLGSGRVTAQEITGRLSIDTGSGGVEVSDVEGDTEVDTGSGSVSLERVRGSRIGVDTGSGTVTGVGLEAERLLVDTGSGGIRLTDVSAVDVEVDTGSGSVTVAFTGGVERLLVDTGSGSVTVGLPEGVDADVELDTGSGRIDVDVPFEVRVMRRDHVEGRLGQGRGLIHVDTGSGSITLRGNR